MTGTIGNIRFSTADDLFRHAVTNNLAKKKAKITTEFARKLVANQHTLPLSGIDPNHMFYNLVLDPSNVTAAIDHYLADKGITIAAIILSRYCFQLTAIERSKAEIDRREWILIIPENNPALYELELSNSNSFATQPPPFFKANPYSVTQLDQELNMLTSEEAAVVRRRLGFTPDGTKHSIEAICRQLRHSDSQIERIQNRALRKLCHFTETADFLANTLQTALFLLEKDAYCTLQELHQALEAQSLVQMTLDNLYKAMGLVIANIGDSDNFHVYASKGKHPNNTAIWKQQDARDKILDTIQKANRHWQINKLREHLACTSGIAISSEKLRGLIETHKTQSLITMSRRKWRHCWNPNK